MCSRNLVVMLKSLNHLLSRYMVLLWKRSWCSSSIAFKIQPVFHWVLIIRLVEFLVRYKQHMMNYFKDKHTFHGNHQGQWTIGRLKISWGCACPPELFQCLGKVLLVACFPKNPNKLFHNQETIPGQRGAIPASRSNGCSWDVATAGANRSWVPRNLAASKQTRNIMS